MRAGAARMVLDSEMNGQRLFDEVIGAACRRPDGSAKKWANAPDDWPSLGRRERAADSSGRGGGAMMSNARAKRRIDHPK